MRTIIDRILARMIASASSRSDREDRWITKAFTSSESLENLFKEVEQENDKSIRTRN